MTPISQAPSVRAAISLGANVMRAALSLLTVIIVARALGANLYGNLAFLLSTFAALALFLDFGTSSAFYTLLSMRARGGRFLATYAAWTIGLQFVIVFVVVGVALPPSAIARIWPGIDRNLVLLALTSSFVVNQVWAGVAQIAESVRKTFLIQVAATLQSLLHLGLILAAIRMGKLSLALLLILPIVEYLLFAVAILPRLLRDEMPAHPDTDESLSSIVRQFAVYCRPLVAYSIVGFVYQFADRWLLQHFAGSTQQGYFAIGQQFGNIAMIAVVSILNVFWKEISEAKERGDHEKMVRIFGQVRRVFFFSTAAASCFLAVHSREIVTVILGSEYVNGTLCLALMLIYPVHQSLGHIQSTFCLATSETRIYTLVGIGTMLASLPITYFVLASASAKVPGFGLGAAGLAGKMLGLQIIAVTIQLELLSRVHKIRRDYGYQLVVMAGLIGLAALCRMLVGAATDFGGMRDVVISTAGAALLYLSIVGALVWRFPALTGIDARNMLAAINSYLDIVRARRRENALVRQT